MSNSNRSLANKKAKDGERYSEITTAFQGPLPSPEILAGFESVLPGAAERIMKMAEKEQDARHSYERKITNSSIVSMILGVCFAFLSVIIIAYLTYLSINKGHTNVAIALSTTTFVGVITAFIWFRKNKTKNR